MSVRQIKKGPYAGRWVVDYYPDGRKGKRERRTLPPEVATEALAKRIEASLKKASQSEPGELPQERTIKALAPRYLAVKAKGSKETYRDIRNAFQANVLPVIGNIEITAIGPEHFAFYKEVRGATGVSNRTINKEVSYIRGLCRWAADQRITRPLMFKTERLPVPKRLPQVLTHAEAFAVVNAAENVLWKCFFSLLYFVGLRLAEAGGLRWNDINWTSKTVMVRGKGDKFRLVPLTDGMADGLKELKAQKMPEPGAYIFHNPATRRPYWYRGALQRAVDAAGVKKHVTPHMFRHTCATELLKRGEGISNVQALLGHSTIAVTQIYTHLNVDDLRRGVDNLTTVKTGGKPAPDKALRRK